LRVSVASSSAGPRRRLYCFQSTWSNLSEAIAPPTSTKTGMFPLSGHSSKFDIPWEILKKERLNPVNEC
jgi:hypothetical protein